MATLRDIVRAVEAATDDGCPAMEYEKRRYITWDRYEECMLALVFLRCLRRRLFFQLSSSSGHGGRFDDMVLVWRADCHPKAHVLLVQVKHKPSPRQRTLHRDTWFPQDRNRDFDLRKYCTSFREVSESLGSDRATCVLLTNAYLIDSSLDMFERQDAGSVPGLDLLHTGGELYKLNRNNQQVWEAVDGDTSFVEHFHLLCKQSSFDGVENGIYGELEELLGAGPLCAAICHELFLRLRLWRMKGSVCLTSAWDKWQKLIDEYIRKEVTVQTEVTTRLKYSSVAMAEVRRYLESRNPAWVRPPEKGMAALSATKVHQAIIHNTHIMVPVSRFRVLQHKILHCWGPFCQWLVIVDDDREQSFDIVSELLSQKQPKRRLVIVSWRESDCFIDTFKSSEVSHESWSEILDVDVRLNGDRYQCQLKDLVADADAISLLLDGQPALLLALAQLSQPLRMGPALEALPQDYLHRKLLARWVVTEELFSTVGRIVEYAKDMEKEQCEELDGGSNIVIVEGRPGMGKSTMLSHVAMKIKERDPACWVLRVDLLKFATILDQSDSAVSTAQDILKRLVFNRGELGMLEYALLRHSLLESPNIVCLVDGFDEVCPDYADKCLEMLPLLTPRKGQLVVTTRPVMVRLLEDRLGVLAYSLEPFSKSDIEEFYTHQPSTTDMPPITSLNKNVLNLLRTPVLAKMFVELTQGKGEIYDIVTMYEALCTHHLRRLYSEKWGNNLSNPGNRRMIEIEQKRLEEQLMVLAASTLLPNTNRPAMLTIDKDKLLATGIVYDFVDREPAFLHRTFAEHFLAKWCFLEEGQQSRAAVYREAYMNKELEFFLEFFDRRAVKDRPLLEAVLDGDEGQVEALLAEGADPGQVDGCGRSTLHLAAAHGERCPAGLLRRLCGHAVEVEALVSAEDGLLGWTPMRYAAEGGHFPAVEQLLGLGSDLSHLGDFTPVHRDPTQLQAIFEGSGYQALYQHVIEAKHRLLDGKTPTVQMEFAVSLVAANVAEESLYLIAEKAMEEGHTIVHSLLLNENLRKA